MDAKKKGILIMGIALVLGLLASMGAVRLLARKVTLSRKAQPVTQKIKMGKVVIAIRDLSVGRVIGPEDIQQVSWPRKLISRTSFYREEELIGRVVKSEIFAGEAIVAQRLAPEGSSRGLGALIPPGMRAMTVEVGEELGASGFFHPGSKVDIIATGRPEGQERVTKIVLQDIEIISVVGEEGTARTSPKTIITLAIQPEEAEKLALALTEGDIQLIVRNALDEEEVATAGVNTRQLLQVRPSGAASPREGEEIEIKVVELIWGEERKEEKFQR